MNYAERNEYGMYKINTPTRPGPRLMGVETLNGNDVYKLQDDDRGDITEIMLNVGTGQVSYAVLS